MPSYFEEHSSTLQFPDSRSDGTGLRRAQRGAIFAIGSHFSLSNANALISMPTGTGKTGVLMMAPYLLRASRTLIITPSRMVRDQIAEEYRSLSLLKRLTVLPAELPCPIVQAIESKILREEQWGTLAAADVVVTTPMGSSPAIEDIPHPPDNLFDLLLVDEAHHSPAKTWRALMQAFPTARQILFTATPFRRDRQQLPGDFVYEFPLREALRDGVFGSISFVACQAEVGVSNDIIIARKAEEIYNADREQGLDHRVMVRTDSRSRASDLQALYEQATALRLAIIHGHPPAANSSSTFSQHWPTSSDGSLLNARKPDSSPPVRVDEMAVGRSSIHMIRESPPPKRCIATDRFRSAKSARHCVAPGQRCIGGSRTDQLRSTIQFSLFRVIWL